MTRKTSRLPVILIVWPFILVPLLLLAMQVIYSQFHPPAVFDELTAASSATERTAYAVNSFLFDAVVAIVFTLAPISIIVGAILGTNRIIQRIRHKHTK